MVGIEVRDLRNQSRLSIAKFAERIGVSSMTIWRWEHKKSSPSQMACRLMEQLKLEINNSRLEDSN